MMIKKLTFILTLAFSLLMPGIASADNHQGDWRLFPAFSRWVNNIVDTPNRTFIVAQQQQNWEGARNYAGLFSYLYVYDKSTDETIPYTMRNKLNDNLIHKIAYNKNKGYLLIVYNNGNIDLLYDDDTVYNIPGLKTAVLRTDKNINSIHFDADNDRAYLTGKFGYLVIDDKKKEIAESHEYGVELFGIARIGDKLLISDESGLLQSPANSKHYTMADFTRIADSPKSNHILRLATDNKIACVTPKVVYVTFEDDGSISQETIISGNILEVSEARDGYLLRENSSGILLKPDYYWPVFVGIPSENQGQPYGSWNHSEFMTFKDRSGLRTIKYDSSDKSWSVIHDYYMPNQPVVYRPWNFTFSDKYGMIISNEGYNSLYGPLAYDIAAFFNTYKDEKWTNHSPIFTNFNCRFGTTDPRGLTVDPINEDIVWTGTLLHGFAYLDLSDPSNTKFYSYAGDNNTKNLPGFHSIFSNGWSCQVSKPEFDNDGTMWMGFNSEHRGYTEDLWYWRAEDRANDDTSKIKGFKVPDLDTKYNFVLPLKHAKNQNIVLVSNNTTQLAVVKHNGTSTSAPTSIQSKIFTSMTDQDNNQVRFGWIISLYEDPETGNVWVCNQSGVFDFAPSEVWNADFRGHRCKVSRNDGSNLADYLLDGITVSRMTNDGTGRKWFATQGAGAILTSADGTEVIRQLTTDNSYIPSDIVYGVGCDPTSNKVWFGTDNGIAEYTSDVTPAEDNYDNVKIFPNPVRPDFLNWVTIEGLMDNSLVKIVDAQGGIVKELGRSNGGSIYWDVCNMAGDRVGSGVYYVMATQSDEGTSGSKIGKILVIK